jgi:hypothetical protein
VAENKAPEEDAAPRDDEAQPGPPNEKVYPGHRINVRVKRNTDPTRHGGKPWLAITTRKGHSYDPVPFGTFDEADAHAEKAIRRADRGVRDNDKSNWD